MEQQSPLQEQIQHEYLSVVPRGAPLPGHEDLIALARHISGVSHAAINLMQHDGHVVVASSKDEVGTTASREDSLCARVVAGGWGDTQVPDLRSDLRFSDSGFVTGELAALRFYATFPLRTPAGVEVGALCVFDEQEHALSPEQLEALSLLARRTVDAFEMAARERELAEAADELVAQSAALERVNAALDAFTGQIGHDLKGPISSLRMSLGMLAESHDASSDEEAWLLESALTAVRRMGSMVEDCLGFARHGGRISRRPVDLAALVAGVRADLTAQLEHVTIVADDLPVVCADASQLGHLLQNLVANAAKFLTGMPDPRIRISAEVLGEDGFRLEVADNGHGVPRSERDRIFDARYQGDHDVPGLGLGLATCLRIASAHGGTVSVDDAPEGGALFVLDVPGVPRPQDRQRPRAQVPSQSAR